MGISVLRASTDKESYLDINDLVTRGQEGIISFTVTGGSAFSNIRNGDIVFVDPFSEPQSGDIVLWCDGEKTCVQIYTQYSQKLYLVGGRSKAINDDSQIKGVIKAHLALYP